MAFVSLTLIALPGFSAFGCRSHHPAATRCDVRTLGSVIDSVNQQQEENAELAKFTIYMHEFEINAAPIDDVPSVLGPETANREPRGYRLTSAGQDHVRAIAQQMLQMAASDGGRQPTVNVVVERSNTSKLSSTVYQYPVNNNPQLDVVRRQMVVSALQQLGVSWAESCVMVAPAFSTGLSASESATAYQRATGIQASSSGGFRSGSGSSGVTNSR